MSDILSESAWSRVLERSVAGSVMGESDTPFPVTPVRRNNRPHRGSPVDWSPSSGRSDRTLIGPSEDDGTAHSDVASRDGAHSSATVGANSPQLSEVLFGDLPEFVPVPRLQFLEMCLRVHLLDSFNPGICSQELVRKTIQDSPGSSPDIDLGHSTIMRGHRTVSHEPPAPVEQGRENLDCPPAADRTVIIAPLPLDLKIRDFIHSLTAPGGLRHIHFAPLPGYPFQLGCITFMTAQGARSYLEYVQQNGFFLSLRVPDESPEPGDYDGESRTVIMQTSNDGKQGVKKVTLNKKHMPDVTVRMWGHDWEGTPLDKDHCLYYTIEHTLLTWFKLNDTWYCNIESNIKNTGATRQLKVLGYIDDVLDELDHIRFSHYEYSGGGVALEFVNYANGVRGGKEYHKTTEQRSTVMIRFYSLVHSIMAKNYFDMRKGYESRSFYVRDYADREVHTLKWNTFPKVGESAIAKRRAVSGSAALEHLAALGPGGVGPLGMGMGMGQFMHMGARDF